MADDTKLELELAVLGQQDDDHTIVIVNPEEGGTQETSYDIDDKQTESESEEESSSEEGEDTISKAVFRALFFGHEASVTEWINSLPAEQRKELINKHTVRGSTALHLACLFNQVELAGLLLEAGADPTVRTKGSEQGGRTALHCACNHDKGDIDELVRQLLERQCDIDVKDEDGCTALYYAAENGRTSTVSLLLDKGAKIDDKGKDGCTALHYAAMKGHAQAVSLLLDKGAKMDAKDESGDTPVHLAAEEGHVEALKVMINRNPQCVHYIGADYETPLHRAEAFRNTEAAEALKQNGARSAKVGTISEVVWRALEGGDVDVVKEWINSLPEEQRQELINKHTHNGRKALHIACRNNQLVVASLLLEAGADPMVGTGDGGHRHFRKGRRTALHSACHSRKKGDIDELVRQLLERKCKIDVKDEDGCTALHYAAENGHTQTVSLLLEKGAKFDENDIDGCTALYSAARKGHAPAVSLLLDKGAKVDVKDWDHGHTALHYAAGSGHTAVVSLLLDKGAKMDTKNEYGDTPVHWAASAGRVEALEVMISHNPQCVHYEGIDSDTPLHRAAAYGHTRAAETLIRNGASATVKNTKGESPLQLCITRTSTRQLAERVSGCQLAKLLLDAGADANARDHADNSPLYEACRHGNTDVVILLMEYGAVVDAKFLDIAVKEGYKRTVVELLKCPQWPELLRHTIGKNSTPFREMIRRMPDVAEEVLNKCTIANPDVSDPGHEDYRVAFNYEFIEDFRDEDDDSQGLEEVDSGRQKNKSEEKKSYDVSFSDVYYRDKTSYTTKWGPVGFKKTNHPLAIMVESGNLELLTHPLVGSLLHHKWNKFGMLFYFFNLFSYSVFLLFLTIFALLVPNPQTTECIAITGSSEVNESSEAMSGSGMATSEISCSTSLAVRVVVYISAGVVIVFALGRLLLELSQVIVHRLSYIKDWINWMELLLYLCSIIFVWIFNTQCQCPYTWQWQIGAIAVFLAWLNLIIFSAKFPLTGIYVLMFVKIFYTFLKMVTLAILLVVAFGLTFYMAFYEPAITRSPFSHPGRSLLKTMTMTTGEFDFDSIFRQDPTGEGDSQEEIPFPPISYILWIVFVILMPILLTNMLIGLATDEIQAIQKEAAVTKLALQVELVLTTEEFLSKRLRRRFITGTTVVYPNGIPSWFEVSRYSRLFAERLGFAIWGGERYDTHSSLERALKHKQIQDPVDVEELEAPSDTGSKKPMETDGVTPTEMSTLLKEISSEVKKCTSQAQSQISEMQNQIAQMQSQIQSQMDTFATLIQELAKKQGVATPQ